MVKLLGCPSRQQIIEAQRQGIFLENIGCLGEDAPPPKSTKTGFLSALASVALVGGLLFLVKKL